MDLSQQNQGGVNIFKSQSSTLIPQTAFKAIEVEVSNKQDAEKAESQRLVGFQQWDDDEELLAQRKQSQIMVHLAQIQKLDSLTRLYKSIAKQNSNLDSYNRQTYLGKPEGKNQVASTSSTSERVETNTDDKTTSKYRDLTKDNAFVVAENDILLSYVAGTKPIHGKNEKMHLVNDLHRLCQLYLKANTKLKLTLPSNYVENLHYEKKIAPEIVSGNAEPRQSNPILQKAKSEENKSFDPAASQSNLTTSQRIPTSKSNQKGSNLEVATIAKGEEAIKYFQCKPQIVTIDSDADDEKKLWLDLVEELKINSTLTADIFRLILQSQENELDLAHSTMLVNLAQFFFDNSFQDDRTAFSDNNLLLRVFLKFAASGISQEKQQKYFTTDSLNRVDFKSETLRNMISCLIEGLTRKIPALNFLRQVFKEPLSVIDINQIGEDIKTFGITQNESKDQEETKDLQQEVDVKKPGFFKRIFKRKQNGKEETKEPVQKHESKSDQGKNVKQTDEEPQIIFEAISFVYDRNSDSLKYSKDDNLKEIKDMSWLIEAERLNTHRLVCEDTKFRFKPEQKDLITVTEDELKAFLLAKFKELKEKELKEKEQKDKQQNGKESQSSLNEQTLEQPKNIRKDITYYVGRLVSKCFEQLKDNQQKIPLAIRAILRIILIWSRGGKDYNEKTMVKSQEVAFLAKILVGSWLNTGLRNPKCFGIKLTIEKDLKLEYLFFQAARIVFEHLMMMQYLPEQNQIQGLSIKELNDMIKQIAPEVKYFWDKLINVDISQINSIPPQSHVQQTIIRVNDLELLYTHCKQMYQIIKKQPVNLEDANYLKIKHFVTLMEKIENLSMNIVPSNHTAQLLAFDAEDTKHVLEKPKRSYRSMSDYFACRINGWTSNQFTLEKYEYYLHFIRKCNGELKKKVDEVLSSNKQRLKSETFKFVAQNLFQRDQDPTNSPLSTTQNYTSRAVNMTQVNTMSDYNTQNQVESHHKPHQNERSEREAYASSQDLHLKKLPRLQEDQISIEKVTSIVIKFLKALRKVLQKDQLLLETLTDKRSNEELRDLTGILRQAALQNSETSDPDLHLQVRCQHLALIIEHLNLRHQYGLQITSAEHSDLKKLTEVQLAQLKQFGDDVFRFEQNIISLKQFHQNFENQINFTRTISQYNPKICLLHNKDFYQDANMNEYYGVLLNLSCTKHNENKKLESNTLIGVVESRQEQSNLNKSLQSSQKNQKQTNQQSQMMGPEEKYLTDVRVKRKKAFRDFNFRYTNATVSIQQFQEQDKASKNEENDEQIDSIESFIQYYTKQKNKDEIQNDIKQDHTKVFIKEEIQKMIKAEQKYEDLKKLGLFLKSGANESFKTQAVEQDKKQTKPLTKDQTLSLLEPLDYKNLVRTYEMFLQHISVQTSQYTKDDYTANHSDAAKFHYDFLKFELKARTLRYSIHEYMISRIYRVIRSQKATKKDILIQQLILARENDPDWVLTSEESKSKKEKYLATKDENYKPKDFTLMPEWTDGVIYIDSLKIMLAIKDQVTPHMKAILFNKAYNLAFQALSVSTPFEKNDRYGVDEVQRVSRHLLLSYCKIFRKENQQSKIYSELLYTLLFNVPVKEHIDWIILNDPDHRGYLTAKMSLQAQIELQRTESGKREIKALDMFLIINSLLEQHYGKLQENK